MNIWQVIATLLSLIWTFFILPGDAVENAIIDGRLLKILESEYPELFSSDFDLVKRYSSYAFGLGKRKPNFSFGIGKRNQLKEEENLNPVYGKGDYIRKRRSTTDFNSIDPSELEQLEFPEKRGSYGFGIGKRYKEERPLYLNPNAKQNIMNDLINEYYYSGFPYYSDKAILTDSESMEGKRAKTPYSFGLGKRGYTFGLGKRSAYKFGLGKRQATNYDFIGQNEDSVNKRKSAYHFGLGKRSYDFGLGKKKNV